MCSSVYLCNEAYLRFIKLFIFSANKVFSQKSLKLVRGVLWIVIQKNLAFFLATLIPIMMTSKQSKQWPFRYTTMALGQKCGNYKMSFYGPIMMDQLMDQLLAKYQYTPRTYICDSKIRNFVGTKNQQFNYPYVSFLAKVHRKPHHLKILHKVSFYNIVSETITYSTPGAQDLN